MPNEEYIEEVDAIRNSDSLTPYEYNQ